MDVNILANSNLFRPSEINSARVEVPEVVAFASLTEEAIKFLALPAGDDSKYLGACKDRYHTA